MYEALLIIFLLVAIGLVGMIMLQQGKGADMGASFGAGASATLFGSGGSGNFMTRTTAILAVVFFIISLVLGNLSARQDKRVGDWDDLSTPVQTEQIQTVPDNTPGSDIPQ